MGRTRNYIEKKLNEPLKNGHPSREEQFRIERLEGLVIALADQIDNVRENQTGKTVLKPNDMSDRNSPEDFFEEYFKEEYHINRDKNKASEKVFDWFDLCDFAQSYKNNHLKELWEKAEKEIENQPLGRHSRNYEGSKWLLDLLKTF